MKVSEVLQDLDQNIEQQEQQIIEIYKKKSDELNKDLMNELKRTLQRIENGIKQQNETVLGNIDWELEQLRTRTRLIWLGIGILTGIIFTTGIISLSMKTTKMSWGNDYTSKVWYLRWDKPTQTETEGKK